MKRGLWKVRLRQPAAGVRFPAYPPEVVEQVVAETLVQAVVTAVSSWPDVKYVVNSAEWLGDVIVAEKVDG